MTQDECIKLVEAMRRAQRGYFRTRNAKLLVNTRLKWYREEQSNPQTTIFQE